MIISQDMVCREILKVNNGPATEALPLMQELSGKFPAYLVDQDFTGAVNGSSYGTISLKEILQYVEQKTGRTASLSDSGEEAPYNGEPEYSINTEVAEGLGFRFSTLKDWIYDLLDYYIKEVENES